MARAPCHWGVDKSHQRYVYTCTPSEVQQPTVVPLGLGAALQTRLAPFILSNADQLNEVQPKGIRVLKIPEYFAEYREKGDGLASFLGSSIVAKVRPLSSYRLLALMNVRVVDILYRLLREELRVEGRLHELRSVCGFRNVTNDNMRSVAQAVCMSRAVHVHNACCNLHAMSRCIHVNLVLNLALQSEVIQS